MPKSRTEYRIIFMGSPEFAIPTLDYLRQAGYSVLAVVTATDKFGGRGNKMLLESAVKKYALEHQIDVLQPKNLKSTAFNEKLRSYEADLQVVVAFRMLPESVWSMPVDGTINLHGSLLPKYRGAAPIHWAIINGERETGLTTFFIDKQIDTGAIIDWIKLPISAKDTTGSMHDKMKVIGAALMLNTVDSIRLKTYELVHQIMDKKEPLAPKLHSDNCRITYEKPLLEIHDFIRGLSPFPGAWLMIDDLRCKILTAHTEVVDHASYNGQLLFEDKKLKLALTGGYLIIDKIQPTGKKALSPDAWLNGYEIKNWNAD